MTKHQSHNRSRRGNWVFWLIGLGSLAWLLLRSGLKPRRLAYPCQRAALVSSLGFVGYLLSLLGAAHLYHRLRQRVTPVGVVLFALALLLTAGLQSGSAVPPQSVHAASPTLPTWTSPTAISNVFITTNVPTPPCSLNGGTLPATAPCNDPAYALHDEGVDSLINLMESKGTYFYKTTQHPDGIMGANDVVVLKVNNQWGGVTDNGSAGHLATNTDVLKGLIWRILQHPTGFSGEVVVAENTQDDDNNWNDYPANAQDQRQSFQDVVNTFQTKGYPVSYFDWTTLNDDLIDGGNIDDGGYPNGEYANGNNNNCYILLEDSDATGTDELSYPKFQTTGGNRVSMRYGVWNSGSSSYDSDQLTFINLPVLKRHGMAGATIAWKNLIGFVTIANNDTRYDGGYGWDEMHDFFWGYTGGTNRNYGLLGRVIARIHAPELNLVDAIWVAYEGNTDGQVARQDVLLASTDPFAVDWYASEYILRPLATWDQNDTSAARDGIFRRATRVNQNSARSEWPGGVGNYPYIDLLDSYNGSTPSTTEKNQMNVYSGRNGSKTPSTSMPQQNAAITYTIVIQNYPAPLTTTLYLTDVVPAGLAYVPGSLTATSGITGAVPPTLTWTGLLSPASAVTVTYMVTVSTATPTVIVNNAAIAAPDYWLVTDTTVVYANWRTIYLPVILKQR